MEISKKPIFLHSFFWLCIFLYHWLVYGALHDAYEGYFYWSLLNTVILAIATYFSIYILIEKYFLTGKKREFIIIGTTALISFAVVRRILNYYLIFKHFFAEKCNLPLFFVPKIFAEGFGIAMLSAMGVMFYFINKWSEERENNQQLLNEKLAAEMELLKSQVQPHFIFNTLNNIYALSITNSSLTSEMIYRLSGLLSYMMYDSKKDFIPIEKEIEYINHYVKLQKLRLSHQLDFAINVYNRIEGIMIPPLMILPFVENCFKHGIGRDASWISIDFSSNEKELIIKIENSLSKENEMPQKNDNSGIGIQNIKNRLNIIYPDNHSLKMIKGENSYLVVMKLPYQNQLSSQSIPNSATHFQ